jgi:CBS domain containing-hemolysin-like protein
MSDPSSSSDQPFRPLLRALRQLMFGRGAEGSLRESLEEVLEDHEGETPEADDLSADERLMLRNLLDFGERRVGDVMVPRGDIIAFDVDGDFASLVAALEDAGHSRLPVYRDSLDDVIGMIHVKDVYARLAREGRAAAASPESLLRPVLFVPPAMRVLDLLARMRQDRTHMAVVVDEYGGTDGLVTIEDLVEEIVGDIADEHDEDVAAPLAALPDGGFEADARLGIEAFETAAGTRFAEAEESDIDTVGGLVFLVAGRVPAVGETVEHASGWRFEVIAGDDRKLDRVRALPPLTAPRVAAAS